MHYSYASLEDAWGGSFNNDDNNKKTNNIKNNRQNSNNNNYIIEQFESYPNQNEHIYSNDVENTKLNEMESDVEMESDAEMEYDAEEELVSVKSNLDKDIEVEYSQNEKPINNNKNLKRNNKNLKKNNKNFKRNNKKPKITIEEEVYPEEIKSNYKKIDNLNDDELLLDNKESNNVSNNKLVEEIDKINQKINHIMNILSKENNVSFVNKNMHDIVLFIVFGLFVIIILDCLSKMSLKRYSLI